MFHLFLYLYLYSVYIYILLEETFSLINALIYNQHCNNRVHLNPQNMDFKFFLF